MFKLWIFDTCILYKISSLGNIDICYHFLKQHSTIYSKPLILILLVLSQSYQTLTENYVHSKNMFRNSLIVFLLRGGKQFSSPWDCTRFSNSVLVSTIKQKWQYRTLETKSSKTKVACLSVRLSLSYQLLWEKPSAMSEGIQAALCRCPHGEKQASSQ